MKFGPDAAVSLWSQGLGAVMGWLTAKKILRNSELCSSKCDPCIPTHRSVEDLPTAPLRSLFVFTYLHTRSTMPINQSIEKLKMFK